jgi:regulator of sigma E protease
MLIGVSVAGSTVVIVRRGDPAYGLLHVGDDIVSVDGRKATATSITAADHHHPCVGTPVVGCRAATPLRLDVRRAGHELAVAIYPRDEKPSGAMSLGIALVSPRPFGLAGALANSTATMWQITASTVSHLFDALTSSKVRAQLHSVVGITQITEQAVSLGAGYGFVILGLVSLILGVMNLFPFLPLDGGHVSWSIAEKLTRRRISTATMWRFSMPGLILLAFLVVSGISNDISRLSGGG